MKKLFLLLIIVVIFMSSNLFAQNMKVSLAQMPVYAESMEKGVLVDLVKAIASESGKKIDYTVVPFPRSIDNVVGKKANFHMPLIALPNVDKTTMKYDYSTETIFHVNFVLYTKKGSKVAIDNLANLKIETELAHLPYFDFKITGSTDIVGSLKKVNGGRIDGFIFADGACDPIIKGNSLTNIKRELYKVFDVKAVLPKGETGGPTDKFLSDIITKMRTNGSYDKIMSVLDMPYNNWQP